MKKLEDLSLKGATLNGMKIIEHDRAEVVVQPLKVIRKTRRNTG